MKIQYSRTKGFGIGVLAAGILMMLLGTSAMSKAQEGRDEAKPPQQEEPKKDEAKPQQKKEEPRDMKPQHEPEKSGKPDHAQEERSGHETHAVAQHGQRIPDEKFRAQFGRQHSFHVQKTVIVEGQPRFQYGGYWFSLANPWPGDWAYTDDCYLDYINGEYVLIDLLHPGVQIAVIVVE